MNDAEKLRQLAEWFERPSHRNKIIVGVGGKSRHFLSFGEDLRRIASDLERKAVSDEEIKAEDRYIRSYTGNDGGFINGARWMREKLTGKS